MRWNLALAGLAASWGLIAIIVAGVDLDATVLVFFRLALASLTMVTVALVLGRPELLRPGGGHGTLVVLGLTLAAHWFLYFETIAASPAHLQGARFRGETLDLSDPNVAKISPATPIGASFIA